MKNLIIQNIINLVLGVLILFLYIFMEMNFAIGLGVVWLFYLIWSNYNILNRTATTSLSELDKTGIFKGEIRVLQMVGQSIEVKRELFTSYEEGDSYHRAFELIESKFKSILASSEKFLKHYDYTRKPDAKYFKKLVTEAHTLAQKLDELSNLVIQIDNTVNDVDSTFVDDIIESLRSVSDYE